MNTDCNDNPDGPDEEVKGYAARDPNLPSEFEELQLNAIMESVNTLQLLMTNKLTPITKRLILREVIDQLSTSLRALAEFYYNNIKASTGVGSEKKDGV